MKTASTNRAAVAAGAFALLLGPALAAPPAPEPITPQLIEEVYGVPVLLEVVQGIPVTIALPKLA
jgi:hypothetical protein